MNRSGMVLVLVLLAVLALELLAVSAFGFARVAQLAARTAYVDAELRMMAEEAVEDAVARIDVRATLLRPVGAAWDVEVPTAAGASATARMYRLREGFLFVRAEIARPRLGHANSAALVRVLEPAAVLAAFPGVLMSAVPPAPLPHVAPPAAGICLVDAFLAPALLPAFASPERGDSLPLGDAAGVSWAAIHRIADADLLVSDSMSAPRLVVIRGPAVVHGRFRGILVVDGDLSTVTGAELHGLIVVRGTLHHAAGANLVGAARVGRLAGGGSFRYDRCAVEAALAVPALTRVYRAGLRWRLPGF